MSKPSSSLPTPNARNETDTGRPSYTEDSSKRSSSNGSQSRYLESLQNNDTYEPPTCPGGPSTSASADQVSIEMPTISRSNKPQSQPQPGELHEGANYPSSGALNSFDSCRELIPERMSYGMRADQLPPSMRIQYVSEGYRFGGTVSDCIRSIFTLRLHTEWLNIWTMIVLEVLGLGLLLHAILYILPRCHSSDITPFLFHFFTCTSLLPGSLGNHTFCCRGPRVHAYWRRADVTGILVAVITLNLAVAYEAFADILPLRIAWPILSAAYSAFFLHKTWTKDYLTQGLDRRQYTLSTGGGAILYMIPPFFILLQDAIKRKMFTAAGAGALGLSGSLFLGGYLFAHHFPEHHPFFQGRKWINYCTGHTAMHFLLWTAHISSYTFLASMFLRRHESIAPI